MEEGRKYKRVEEQNQETELTGGLEQQEVAEHPELSKILEQAKILHNEIWAKETFTPKDYVCQARLYKLWRELEDPWYMRNPENEVLDQLRKTGKLKVFELLNPKPKAKMEEIEDSEKDTFAKDYKDMLANFNEWDKYNIAKTGDADIQWGNEIIHFENTRIQGIASHITEYYFSDAELVYLDTRVQQAKQSGRATVLRTVLGGVMDKQHARILDLRTKNNPEMTIARIAANDVELIKKAHIDQETIWLLYDFAVGLRWLNSYNIRHPDPRFKECIDYIKDACGILSEKYSGTVLEYIIKALLNCSFALGLYGGIGILEYKRQQVKLSYMVFYAIHNLLMSTIDMKTVEHELLALHDDELDQALRMIFNAMLFRDDHEYEYYYIRSSFKDPVNEAYSVCPESVVRLWAESAELRSSVARKVSGYFKQEDRIYQEYDNNIERGIDPRTANDILDQDLKSLKEEYEPLCDRYEKNTYADVEHILKHMSYNHLKRFIFLLYGFRDRQVYGKNAGATVYTYALTPNTLSDLSKRTKLDQGVKKQESTNSNARVPTGVMISGTSVEPRDSTEPKKTEKNEEQSVTLTREVETFPIFSY